jgi:hypothetical protein
LIIDIKQFANGKSKQKSGKTKRKIKIINFNKSGKEKPKKNSAKSKLKSGKSKQKKNVFLFGFSLITV